MSIGKIKSNAQLNERHLKMCKIMHSIADQVFPQIRDAAFDSLHKAGFTELTGNESLGLISTLSAKISALMIYTMKEKIVNNDDCDYSLDQIQQSVFDLTAKTLGTKNWVRKPIYQETEFKRLKAI